MNGLKQASDAEQPNSFPISQRYTDDLRKALSYAAEEARARHSKQITTSDLLAGLGVDESTRASRVGLLKENAFYLRWLTGAAPLPAVMQDPAISVEATYEFDPSAKRALACAVSEADRDREYRIDSDHLLRGLLCFPNSADFALLKTEVTLSSARANSRRDREEFLPETNPSLKTVEYLVRKHLTLWLPPIVSLACYLYILMQTIGSGVIPAAH